MAQFDRLSALTVTRIKDPGIYPDGGGLYLQVTVSAPNREPAKSWIYRYKLRGRERQMGLGSLREFGLKEARERVAECRRQRRDGIDPIEAQKAARAQAALEAARSITFKVCAERYIAGHKVAWRNEKHAHQWSATLERYAYPVIGAIPVQCIDTDLVLKILELIWTKKPETAGRVRGRIENILDWAAARGYRNGDNPARWRGHMENLLPKRSKVRRMRRSPITRSANSCRSCASKRGSLPTRLHSLF